MSFEVNELDSARYTATLKDEAGVAVSAASLTTLTLTLYDARTGTVINSRNAQNVLNNNQVTLDSSGNLVWSLLPADNAVVATAVPAGAKVDPDGHYLEKHIALFRAVWSGGTKAVNKEVIIYVVALDKLP